MSATTVRGSARVLSGLVLLVWGTFLAAHLFGEAGRPSRPLVVGDYIGLTAIVLSLVGLAAAWRWELAGAAMTLLAVCVGAVVNPNVLVFPGTLIPAAAVLFLAAWWMSRNGEGGPAASSATA